LATKIFSNEELITYAETRLFGSNVTRDDVDKFHLYNGVLPSDMKKHLAKNHGNNIILVGQKNRREPLFFTPDTRALHIPQYSGISRESRYEEMIKAYLQVSNMDPNGFQAHAPIDKHGAQNHRLTLQHYDNYAYDFVTGLVVPEPRHNKQRIFKNQDISDIDTIVFGPPSAMAKQGELIAQGKSEYLDAQILNIHGKKVLNIGYVFADQAATIISKLLREYDAISREDQLKREITMYLFGRVGGLTKEMKRDDLIMPNSVIDLSEIYSPTRPILPFHNILGDRSQGRVEQTVLNVKSVVNETYGELEAAIAAGCRAVEMESMWCAESINHASRVYQRNLTIHFGFVGHVSDLPLVPGDSLAKELETDDGEQRAVQKIVEHIQDNH
jgi:hypothetical protein